MPYVVYSAPLFRPFLPTKKHKAMGKSGVRFFVLERAEE